MELCLGSAQFGMDYGIRGQRKPSLQDAVKCLDYATQNGITALDTAEAYGNAQEVLGAFLARKTIPRDKLKISTKFLPNVLDERKPEEYADFILERLKETLRTLHLEYVDAYLFHSARYAFCPDKLEALYQVKEKGLTKKVGVSVYEPEEAYACFESPYVDFIQAPYSLFDHRMKEAGVFDSPKRGACEIHTRSAFIQGLVTLDEDEIPPFLQKAKPIVRRMDEICRESGVSRIELAFAYVKREQTISHLVFGVDNIEQLKEDISLFRHDLPEDLLAEMDQEFKGIEADIVMPSLWKK